MNVKVIDLINIEVNGVSQPLVGAILNYPEFAHLIQEGLEAWDKARSGEATEEQLAALEKTHSETIEQLEKQITDRDARIAQLELEIAPDLAAIAPALQAAGLDAWADRAITKADPDKGVLGLVLQLFSIANSAKYPTQCDNVKALFINIGATSEVWPTPEESIAMQAVLDGARVSDRWLKFA